jgi:UDP-glucose 4-epimerase
MKVVVFGGSGFLGSHVADALTEEGHDVVIFDRAPSPYIQCNQKMIVGSILDINAVEEAVFDADIVYNFAGVADIDEANSRPLDTVNINILGNTTILEACRLHGIKRFVFASSVYVYSNAGSFYRSSKQACELIIENYNEQYGLSYTILRYGSLYGLRSNETNWVYNMLLQAIVEGKITRYGDGDELREYIHVEDAARYSVDILSEQFENAYVIIAGPQQMKVKDMMIMVKEMLGNEIELDFLPVDSSLHYEITPYSFSPKKAQKYVGNRYIDLGQGTLEMLSELYKKHYPNKEQNGLY